MPTFSIQLFGKFCVRRDQQILEGFEARKVQELFCYLLLHRDHPIPRETLAGLLWPETTTAQSKKNLRQALWLLQSALVFKNKRVTTPVFFLGQDWATFNSGLTLWWNLGEF